MAFQHQKDGKVPCLNRVDLCFTLIAISKLYLSFTKVRPFVWMHVKKTKPTKLYLEDIEKQTGWQENTV